MAQRIAIDEKEFVIDFTNDERTIGTINGRPFELDVSWLSETKLNIIQGTRSINVELLDDLEGKRQIKVNGVIYQAKVIGQFDELLRKMGIHSGASSMVSEIKAPMPGMVLEVSVATGDVVRKGDRVLVLEAMKMENVIKSPTDGTIGSIEVEKGKILEKNQVMIRFAKV